MLGIKPEIVLFGLTVGILIGLTGIGGGSLMTPLLIVVLGVTPVTAIGTDIAYGAITKTFGGASHLRKHTVDLTVSLWLALGSVPGTLLGVILVSRLHSAYGKSFEHVLLAFVAGALLVVSAVVLIRSLAMTHLAAREQHKFHFTPKTKAAAIAMGFVLGGTLGLTSVGTGALIGVAMMLVFRLTPQRVAGTSVVHGALLLWVAGVGYVVAGNVDFGLMGNILIGSIPGVWLGAHFVNKIPAQALRVTLGAVLLGSALAMVSKAGVQIPAPAIIGAPLAAGLLGYLLHLGGVRPAPAPSHMPAPSGPRANPPGGPPPVAAPILAAGGTRFRAKEQA